jgi:hypothetical protein
MIRGDTVGYLCEVLQAYMIRRLENANLLAINKFCGFYEIDSKLLERYGVQRDDIALAFGGFRDSRLGFTTLPFSQPACNVATKDHGTNTTSVLHSSCSLPSSDKSAIVWRWPTDDCHDVLPPEAGRRIVRRLAFRAGVVVMSDDAFILAEAELLHALGLLLVSAYESSVEMSASKNNARLHANDYISYNDPIDSIDMFKTPPPLSWKTQEENQPIYTIVPGQIKSAAEQRDIQPYNVYGITWVPTSGFTAEEEFDIEMSYYYDGDPSNDEMSVDDSSHPSDLSEDEYTFGEFGSEDGDDIVEF